MPRPQPIRLTHVTPALFGTDGYVGGGERYVRNVARAVNMLSKDTIIVSIVGFTKRDARAFEDEGVKCIALKSDSYPESHLDVFSKKLWLALADADLVHIHQPFTLCGRVALVVAGELGKKIIVTDLGGGEITELDERLITIASHVIAISQYSADLLRASVAIEPEVVIGPVSDQFLEAPLRESDRHGILYVGRLMPHKGIDRLIQSTPSGYPLTVAGVNIDQDYERYLRSISSEKDVKFVINPADSEILELYSGAALHVAPSVHLDYLGRFYAKSELMGLTTMEALAMGTPVAVAQTGSLPELVRDSRVGQVFASNDELSAFLGAVASGRWPGAVNAYRQCRQYAQQNFRSEIIGRKLLKIYDEVLSKSVQ